MSQARPVFNNRYFVICSCAYLVWRFLWIVNISFGIYVIYCGYSAPSVWRSKSGLASAEYPQYMKLIVNSLGFIHFIWAYSLHLFKCVYVSVYVCSRLLECSHHHFILCECVCSSRQGIWLYTLLIFIFILHSGIYTKL